MDFVSHLCISQLLIHFEVPFQTGNKSMIGCNQLTSCVQKKSRKFLVANLSTTNETLFTTGNFKLKIKFPECFSTW